MGVNPYLSLVPRSVLERVYSVINSFEVQVPCFLEEQLVLEESLLSQLDGDFQPFLEQYLGDKGVSDRKRPVYAFLALIDFCDSVGLSRDKLFFDELICESEKKSYKTLRKELVSRGKMVGLSSSVSFSRFLVLSKKLLVKSYPEYQSFSSRVSSFSQGLIDALSVYEPPTKVILTIVDELSKGVYSVEGPFSKVLYDGELRIGDELLAYVDLCFPFSDLPRVNEFLQSNLVLSQIVSLRGELESFIQALRSGDLKRNFDSSEKVSKIDLIVHS